MLAVGKVFEREQALDWLTTAIDDGRAELEAQHALEREIEMAPITAMLNAAEIVARAREEKVTH